jgi:hypothetical protein
VEDLCPFSTIAVKGLSTVNGRSKDRHSTLLRRLRAIQVPVDIANTMLVRPLTVSSM